MSEHANREQAIHTLRTRLLEMCLDEEQSLLLPSSKHLRSLSLAARRRLRLRKTLLRARLSVPSWASMQHGRDTGRASND
jgi:hypothetical protein